MRVYGEEGGAHIWKAGYMAVNGYTWRFYEAHGYDAVCTHSKPYGLQIFKNGRIVFWDAYSTLDQVSRALDDFLFRNAR